MILKDNLYTVQEARATEGGLAAVLELNALHPIFNGHFPGQPVLPGVCMVQIVKELTSQEFQAPIRLVKGSECKFLAVVDPRIHSAPGIEINYTKDPDGQIVVSARIFIAETVFFKFKGIFQAG
jgi:3-hydroxyacyl-[acyl-carrier-protein] dehydratase